MQFTWTQRAGREANRDRDAASLRAGSAGPRGGRGLSAGLRPGDRREGRVAPSRSAPAAARNRSGWWRRQPSGCTTCRSPCVPARWTLSQEALERSGTPVTDPPPGATPDGLSIRDPDGTAVQLLAEEPSPAPAGPRGADQHGRDPSADRHRLVAAGHRGCDAAAAGAHAAVHRAARADDGVLYQRAGPAGQ